MSRINTNITALRAVHQLGANQRDLDLRLERLATGLRINRGADDPAGLIASETLRSEIVAIGQAIENSARANNVISTAEGALNEVSALLLELQSLIVSSANEAGLTDEEIRANQLQVDSILASIDRIGQTTTFGGLKLLDGAKAYRTSAVDTAAIASLAVFSARTPQTGPRTVTVRITQSAQVAQVPLLGNNPGGISTISATTVEIRGSLGAELMSFASGTTLAEAQAAINHIVGVTGVSAVVSAGGAGTASALMLQSTAFGSDAFVSVSPIVGNFGATASQGQTIRSTGVDAGVLIDGQPAAVKGLRADVRANGLDARLFLQPAFAQTLSSAAFTIAGGGGVFQLAPEVHPHGQLFVGLERIATTTLGNSVTGLLYTLRSGGANDLASRNSFTAQQIVNEAVNQVASYRGRLGSLQHNHIEPNINSQRVALENVTASESVIRDADLASEISALTRAQILVQSTGRVLQIANSVPQQVLSLLE